mmetsp:Transcript_33410/g.84415  ORF Transcript_33410/g.84415 Transcript_33410/m.84415 type:complete len:173 (+) Transcript_33410:100-618(+)
MSESQSELEAIDAASNSLPEGHWRVKAAKARRAAKVHKEDQMFDKIARAKAEGRVVTGEAADWFANKLQTDPEAQNKLKVRELARKSLSGDSWAGELMKGESHKFSASAKNSVDQQLKDQVVGLVTYDDYKRKREKLEEEAAAKLAEAAEGKPKKKKKKAPTGPLSFDDEDE